MTEDENNSGAAPSSEQSLSGLLKPNVKPPKPTRRKPVFAEQPESKRNPWLTSFTDVMALMLTFFVLLFAMTDPEEKAWVKMVSALEAKFNISLGAMFQAGINPDKSINRLKADEALDLNYLAGLFEKLLEDNEDLQEIVLRRKTDRLVITLPENLLFESGKTELNENGRKSLFILGGILGHILNGIEVYGHADPRPVGERSKFQSNWDLSLTRASIVAAELNKAGYWRSIIVQGLSSREYAAINPTLEEEARNQLARRVDIVVHADASIKETFGERISPQ